MTKGRAAALGCGVAVLVAGGCLLTNVAALYVDEGREIQLCMAIKDFWDASHRAPLSIAELPAPYSGWTSTADGQPYSFACHDEGGVPSCGLSWSEEGRSIGRNCGRLDTREFTDWF
jgi:hypothetical protein